jgi:glycosyltransferase involved in cell wall biosynthesis
MERKPRISVIVPAYNAEKTIDACLAALREQEKGTEPIEVIVVDDGSKDRTLETVLHYPGVICIRENHGGPARARNAGVRLARGEIVLFTDADCEPAQDWVKEMAKPFEDNEVAGVKGTYRTKQKEWVAKVVQAEYEGKYERMAKRETIDFIDTYSAGFRRAVFLQAGGFDPFFPNASVEDQEFSFRLARLGCKMVFNPRAVVYHRHAASLIAYFLKKFRIGCWKIPVLKRHPGKILRDAHTPQTLKVELVVSFAGLVALAGGIFSGEDVLVRLGHSLLTVFAFLAALEMRQVFSKNVLLGTFSVLVLFLRSMALGTGMIYGFRKV